MKISSECISCVLGSVFELMSQQLPPEKHPALAAEMLKIASAHDWNDSPPDLARKLYDFLHESITP